MTVRSCVCLSLWMGRRSQHNCTPFDQGHLHIRHNCFMPSHNGCPLLSPMPASFHINNGFTGLGLLVYIHHSIQSEAVCKTPGHTLKRTNHLRHQTDYICSRSPQFSVSLHWCKTHSWTVKSRIITILVFVYFESLETPAMIISLAFLLQHLPCSTEEEMEIQQPTSLLGHICLHISCRLCTGTHDHHGHMARQVSQTVPGHRTLYTYVMNWT